MRVNYVLMYGTPYLRYREFETFEDISKFLVNKSIVNYSIFKKLEDKEEVEMIYRDNDIRYLQEENEKLKELCNKYEEEHSSEFKIWKNERQQLRDYKSKNEEAIEYINKTQMPEGYKNELLNLLKGE